MDPIVVWLCVLDSTGFDKDKNRFFGRVVNSQFRLLRPRVRLGSHNSQSSARRKRLNR